ncbi:MAG: hypothetical protein RBR06_06220 [Desulfuromonadaceae bacterium]|nr:hypothetical protein [Desulfuromonadaceae bacterium]
MKPSKPSDINCAKCHAGHASLYVDATGATKALVCARCGWRMYAAAEVVKPFNETWRIPSSHCKTGGAVRHGTDQRYADCKVLGCPNGVDRTRNDSGFCSFCRALMRRWEGSKRTRPAPFIQAGNGWHRNPVAPLARAMTYADKGYAGCKIDGCENRVNPSVNGTGMCASCRATQASWEQSKRTQPPPFVCVDGRWYRKQSAPIPEHLRQPLGASRAANQTSATQQIGASHA